MASSIVAPKTFLTYSLGCRTNQAEVEDIGSQLMAYGLQQTLKEPNIVLLNTCVVTQKAEKETRQKIRELRKKYPNSFLVVTGCAVSAKEKFKINLPSTNLFIPNNQKNRIIKLLEQYITSNKSTGNYVNSKYILSGRKFIKIQDGCNCGCSFCLTQFLRGEPTSITKEKIIDEINFWVGRGIKEVILTGINIGLYDNLTELLNKILSKTKIERLSFSSVYPEMLSNDFLKLVVGNTRITQCFHLSLQSGSQSVLERMNRKYDINKLKKSLLFIKQQIPEFTFRADIITGFPNETEQELQETLNFIKKYKIAFAHIFTYSPRTGTTADEMIKSKKWQDLSEKVKKERSEKIKLVVEEIRIKEAQRMIGVKTNCLIVRKQNDYWEGITENGLLVKINSSSTKTKVDKGKIIPVKIIDFENPYFRGLN